MIRIIYGFKVGLEKGQLNEEVLSLLRNETVTVSGLDYLTLNGMFLTFSVGIFVKKETGLDLFPIKESCIIVGAEIESTEPMRIDHSTLYTMEKTCWTETIERIVNAYQIFPAVWIYSVND